MRIAKRSWVLTLLFVAGLAAFSSRVVAREDPANIDVTKALDLYDRSDPGVLAALANLPNGSAPQMLGDLAKRGPAWVRASGPPAVDHRRLVLAAFTLEAAKGIRAKGGPVSVSLAYIKKLIDPKWEPILNTPPFPEYPSGHSTASAAAAALLTAFFGEDDAF